MFCSQPPSRRTRGSGDLASAGAFDAEGGVLLDEDRVRLSKLGLAQAARKELARSPEPGWTNLHGQNTLGRIAETEIRLPQQTP
jgi:hypothetical protein